MKARSPENSDYTSDEQARAAEGLQFGTEALLDRFYRSSPGCPGAVAENAREIIGKVIQNFFGNLTPAIPLVVRADEGVWVSFTPTNPGHGEPYQQRPALAPWDELLGKTVIKETEVKEGEGFSELDNVFSGLMEENGQDDDLPEAYPVFDEEETALDDRVMAPVDPDKTPLIDEGTLDILVTQTGKAAGDLEGALEAYVQEHGFTATPDGWMTTTPLPTAPLELDQSFQNLFDQSFPPEGDR